MIRIKNKNFYRDIYFTHTHTHTHTRARTQIFHEYEAIFYMHF